VSERETLVTNKGKDNKEVCDGLIARSGAENLYVFDCLIICLTAMNAQEFKEFYWNDQDNNLVVFAVLITW